MPQRFKVLLQISGVSVPAETGHVDGGFYVTVVVRADGTQEAVDAAIGVLRASTKYQRVAAARTPVIVPQEVEAAAPHQPDGLLTGFVFFPKEDGNALS